MLSLFMPHPLRETSQKLMMQSKNLQNITQTSSVHLAFFLGCVPQLDSELPDLSLKPLNFSLELAVLFNDLVNGFSALGGFSFDFSDSDVLLVEQVDQTVVCFGSSFHDDGVLMYFCFVMWLKGLIKTNVFEKGNGKSVGEVKVLCLL